MWIDLFTIIVYFVISVAGGTLAGIAWERYNYSPFHSWVDRVSTSIAGIVGLTAFVIGVFVAAGRLLQMIAGILS